VVQKILNKQSGVLGVSGLSNDFRDLELAAEEGNERASLALTIFANGLRKYIAAYAAVMNGVDAIIFTAGIGENSKEMRSRICEGLKFLGVAIDEEKNNCRSVERDISAPQSKVRVLIVPTNEELVIARDTREIAFS
jgi:acetate kinase